MTHSTIGGTLAVLAMVIVGCASPRQDADATPTARSSGPATLDPDACPLELQPDSPSQAAISYMGPRAVQGAEIALNSIVREVDGQEMLTSGGDHGPWASDFVIGGRALTLAFELKPDPGTDVTLTDLQAWYRPPGLVDEIPLAVAVVDDGYSITIPDSPGSADLGLTVGWTDGCFSYAGTVRFAFEVIPSAVADACPSDAEGLGEILRLHADDRIVVDGVARSIGTLSYSARYATYNGADQVGAFGSWDPQAEGVDATIGELLEAADDDADLRLSGGTARIYLQTDENSMSPDGLVEVSAAALVPNADGRLEIISPAATGSYVLELSTSWELDCLTGSGLAYFSVDVSSPVGGLPHAPV
jgi:hypothetical protein